MRLVMLSTFREHCGIATYTEALVDALGYRGVQVEVLAPQARAGSPAQAQQPVRLWSRERASVGEALQTFREIRRRGADAVHVQLSLGLFSSSFMLVLVEACRRVGIHVVVTLHERRGGGVLRDLRFSRMLLALRGAELIVHNREHALELAGRQVHVIPHGSQLAAGPDPARSKQALGLDPERAVIAHFGFIHPDKGIEEVMRAVATLGQRQSPAPYYLICGATFPTATSRRHLDRLRRLSRELGIAEHVGLSGEFLDVDRLLGQLGAADWIVLNYRTGNSQSTSGAVRHAFLAGRPIAVSIAPVFDDIRAAVHTLEQPLAAELPRLLADSRLQRDVMARMRVRSQAESWSQVAATHLELFEGLVARSQNPLASGFAGAAFRSYGF